MLGVDGPHPGSEPADRAYFFRPSGPVTGKSAFGHKWIVSILRSEPWTECARKPWLKKM